MEEIEKAIVIAKRELSKATLDRLRDIVYNEGDEYLICTQKMGNYLIDIKKQTSIFIQ